MDGSVEFEDGESDVVDQKIDKVYKTGQKHFSLFE